MVLTPTLNPRFNFLNANALRTKVDFGTRERRAIVDIVIPNNEAYVAGGFTVDLTKIRNFIEVYAGHVINQPLLGTANLEFRLVPDASNDADKTKLAIVVISSGAEQSAGAVPGPITVTVEIIGI